MTPAEQARHAEALAARAGALRASITAERVAAACALAGKRWAAPDARACEALAVTIRLLVAEREAVAERRAALGANAESFRRLHHALADDLPALAERLRPILPAESDHARALAGLAAAAERFHELFPPLPPRAGAGHPEWQGTANTLGPLAHYAMRRANPGCDIEPPGRPMARVLLALLALAGHEAAPAGLTAAALAQHCRRHPWPDNFRRPRFPHYSWRHPWPELRQVTPPRLVAGTPRD